MECMEKGALGMTRRQVVALGAATAAALALGGCAPQSPSPATGGGKSALSFTPGVYAGAAEGRGGLVTVEVAFGENAIEAVTVIDHAETSFISDMALEELPARIVEHQSTGLDAITGATVTSMAIKAAVEDAARQADGDVSALQKAPEIEKSTEVKDITCDVAVAGAGAGGVGVAIAAAEAGAKVVLVEKTSNIGGNAFVSGGLLEFIDAPQEMRAEMTPELEDYFNVLLAEARAGGAAPEFVDALQADHDAYYADGKTTVYDTTGLYALERCQVERAGDYSSITADTPVNDRESPFVKVGPWLTGLGMELQAPLDVCFGYIWPNFTVPADQSAGYGGAGYFDFFKKTFLDPGTLDIELITCTSVTELIKEGDAVVGFTAVADDGTTYHVRASRGTVLATGGYAGNPDMLKEYNTTWSWDDDTVIISDNTAGHKGDGIVMALDAGAQVDGMGSPELFPTVDPVQHIIENVVCFGPFLNKEGERFVDEMKGRFDIVEATLQQTDHMLYIPCDSVCLAVVDGYTMGGIGPSEEALVERGMLYRADTLEELAEQAGVNVEGLVASVAKWNEMVVSGQDPDCGRTIFTNEMPIETPPFYLSPATFAAHATQGGVVVDGSGQALRADGTPIEGLYCVGELVFDRLGVRSVGEGMDVGQKLMA